MFLSHTGRSTDDSACVCLPRVPQHRIRVSRIGLTGFSCQGQAASAFAFTGIAASVSVTVYSMYSLSLHLSGSVSPCSVDASVVKYICSRSCFAKSRSETARVKQWQLKWASPLPTFSFGSQKAQSPLSSSVACWKRVPRGFCRSGCLIAHSHTLFPNMCLFELSNINIYRQ